MLFLTKIQFLIEAYFHKLKKEHYDDILYIIVIYNGKIVESGKITDVINNPQDSYTKHLINSLPKFGAS